MLNKLFIHIGCTDVTVSHAFNSLYGEFTIIRGMHIFVGSFQDDMFDDAKREFRGSNSKK